MHRLENRVNRIGKYRATSCNNFSYYFVNMLKNMRKYILKFDIIDPFHYFSMNIDLWINEHLIKLNILNVTLYLNLMI